MKKIAVILKKELIDILRDRRSLMMMVVLPILLIYLVMNLTITLSRSQTRKAEEKILKVALITHGNASDLRAKFLEREDMEVSESVAADEINELIQEKKLDFAIEIEEGFDGKVTGKESGEVKLIYKSSRENNIAKRRILALLKEYRKKLLSVRLEELSLSHSFVEPLTINETDLSTQKEKLGEMIGGFLPYFFVIFCFMGAMYPAIDLAAGEKERATLETLLTSPASRMQIVMGKFIVVTMTGIITAAISILALYFSIKGIREIPKNTMETLIRIIEPNSVGLLASLLVPLCMFFAASLLSISIFARSYKEAQSFIMPLYFMVLVPVVIGLFPGIYLNASTALIPVLNVSLATKEIVSGTIKTGLLLEVYASLLLLAALSLTFCSWWFKREEVIFRGI
jgi:sodium transport system permease protein